MIQHPTHTPSGMCKMSLSCLLLFLSKISLFKLYCKVKKKKAFLPYGEKPPKSQRIFVPKDLYRRTEHFSWVLEVQPLVGLEHWVPDFMASRLKSEHCLVLGMRTIFKLSQEMFSNYWICLALTKQFISANNQSFGSLGTPIFTGSTFAYLTNWGQKIFRKASG